MINNQKSINKKRVFLLCAMLFFISYKFILNYIIWDRPLPPEPDDSYSYILYPTVIQADGFIPPHSDTPLLRDHADYTKAIPFNIIFISLSDLTDLSIETLYQINFYFGIVFLALILYYFFKKLGNNDLNLISIGLLTLAFYDGEGSFHGFFWVVPSFYAVTGFIFVVASFFRTDKKGFYLSLMAIPSLVLVHPTFLYAIIFTLVAYFVLHSVIYKSLNKELIKKMLVLFLIIFASFFIYKICLHHQGALISEKASLTTTIAEKTQNTEEGFLFISCWQVIKNDFFRYFSLNGIYLSILVLSILCSLIAKKYRLLIIIASLFALILISPIAKYGYRFLVYLWPFIYILFAYTFYYLFFKQRGDAKKYLFLIFFILLMVTQVNANFYAALYRKSRLLYSWDQNIVNYILADTLEGDYVIYDNKYSFFTLAAHGLYRRKLAYADWDFSVINPLNKYLVLTAENDNEIYKKGLKKTICLNNNINCNFSLSLDGDYFKVYKIHAKN